MGDTAPAKTEAIVLRAIPWSETSLIVTLWTRDSGKVGAIAKGARRLRSPFESALDLLSHSSVVFIFKSGDALDLLTEAKLIRRFRSGQQHLLNLYCGYYLAELLLFATEEGEPIPELFDLAIRTLIDLDTYDHAAETMLRFELHLLRLLGLAPSLEICVGCGCDVAMMASRTGASSLSGRVAIGIEAGGVLCDACLPGQRDVLRLRHETLTHLNRCLRNAWGVAKPVVNTVRTAQPIQAELRNFIQRYLSAKLHRSFELHPFLKELAR